MRTSHQSEISHCLCRKCLESQLNFKWSTFGKNSMIDLWGNFSWNRMVIIDGRKVFAFNCTAISCKMGSFESNTRFIAQLTPFACCRHDFIMTLHWVSTVMICLVTYQGVSPKGKVNKIKHIGFLLLVHELCISYFCHYLTRILECSPFFTTQIEEHPWPTKQI